MGRMSREKGKVGEREAAKFLRELGFTSAARTQQFRGTKDSPDVLCAADLPNVAIEVKRNDGFDLHTALLSAACEQAAEECGEKEWAVLWRPNRKPWRLTFEADGPALIVTVADPQDIRHALLWLNQMKREAIGIAPERAEEE